MEFGLALLVGVSVANLLLGLFVLLRNPRLSVMRAFFAISVFITLWAVSNYFTENAIDIRINTIAGRFAYLFGFLAIVSTAFFSSIFTKRLKRTTINRVIFTLLIFGMSIASVTEYVAGTVNRVGGQLVFTQGSLISVYTLALLYCVVLIIKDFKYLLNKGSSAQKNQAIIIASSLVISIIIGVVSNVVIPGLTGDYGSTKFGPAILSLFLISSMTYAIIKHKVFNMRFVVAKALGYLLSIFVLGITYGFIAFNLINVVIFRDADLTFLQRAIYTMLAVLIAFSFGPIKKFFDRVTNKLFYQDAYSSQDLIDELNQVIVSTIDLSKMLKSSAGVISSNIKPEFCVFGLRETEHESQRIIGESDKKFSKDDINFAKNFTPKMDHKVIVADYLEAEDKELQSKMRRNDVAVLVRLTSDVNQEGIGYIVLGDKKSGNPYNSQDIQALEIIANSMVIAIDNALRFEEIQKFNVTLEKKVEDATSKLQKANDKLIALDQTKDDFISMASHQLRTPLTSVKGYLSMVLEGDAGKVTPKQEKLLDQAFISSQRMVYLIADLLNVSRLRTGKFVIEPTEVDLAQIIQEEVNQLLETAQAKNLKLSYKMPKKFPPLMLDETKIRQVAMNFIDNAIYYTPSGGEIVVELKETPQTIEYTVKDSGIGVPKHEQHNLFTKFFRAKNARKARPDGTGLGLFMAKKVVVAQGGAVVFSSQEGKGSTFGFTFNKEKLAVKK